MAKYVYVPDAPFTKPARLVRVARHISRHRYSYTTMVGMLAAWFVVGTYRGMKDEYTNMAAQLAVAKIETAKYKAQVNEMIKHGDNGIRLARVNTVDWGWGEIRFLPTGVR